MCFIIKKCFINKALLIKSETIKNEAKEQIDLLLLGALGANLLGNLLTGKGVIKVGKGTIRINEKTIRAGENF